MSYANAILAAILIALLIYVFFENLREESAKQKAIRKEKQIFERFRNLIPTLFGYCQNFPHALATLRFVYDLTEFSLNGSIASSKVDPSLLRLALSTFGESRYLKDFEIGAIVIYPIHVQDPYKVYEVSAEQREGFTTNQVHLKDLSGDKHDVWVDRTNRAIRYEGSQFVAKANEPKIEPKEEIAFCDMCPHAMHLHNPDGTCPCGINCPAERRKAIKVGSSS